MGMYATDQIVTNRTIRTTQLSFYRQSEPESFDSLEHHGIKNQKWGVRRFQNPDGTLTPAGKKRYKKDSVKETKDDLSNLSDDELRNYVNRHNLEKQYRTARDEASGKTTSIKIKKKVKDMTDQELKDYLNRRELETKYKKATNPVYAVGKTVAVVGGVVLTARLNKKMNGLLDLGESKTSEVLDSVKDKSIDVILDILEKVHGE